MISRSAFLKYLNNNRQYKKPHRLTDLCDYCEWGRYTKFEIKEIISSIESEINSDEEINIDYLIKHFLKKSKLQWKRAD